MKKHKELYEILNVEPTASQAEIKKAYHQLALRLHPDKNPDDKEANENFKKLQKVYEILRDPERRRVYDESGFQGDDLDLNLEDMKSYFRAVFVSISAEDIDRFAEEYRGSPEEAAHVKDYYAEFRGVMRLVYEYVMLSDPDTDDHRFMDIIQAAIDAGELKNYKAFQKWSAEVQKRPRPADPLKPKRARKKGGESSSLTALTKSIQSKSGAAEKLFDSLIEKYGGKEKGAGRGSKKRAGPEPSEEEFAAASARLFGKPRNGSPVEDSKKNKVAGQKKRKVAKS